MAVGVDRSFASSSEHLERAQRYLIGGVGSAARLRTASPSLVFETAQGARLRDIDGNEYVDFALGLGPVLLGHNPPAVVDAARDAMQRGVIYAGQNRDEARFAELAVEALPSAEIAGLASTGTEAMHLAVRLAQVGTGRRRVIKFTGHYHGWADPLFVNAPWLPTIEGSGGIVATHNVPGREPSADVTVLRWNEPAAIEAALEQDPPVAAVFMEPVPCNYGTFPPVPGYMQAVRDACTRAGTLLVFDEVLTGFRLALGGAQELLGVDPDITVASKAVAAGFPGALIAGSRKAMAPLLEGRMRIGGTYNGSPTSMAAGVATLTQLRERREELYPYLDRLGQRLAEGVRMAARSTGAPLEVNQVGSVLQFFWGADRPITTYEQGLEDDRRAVATLAAGLLARGFHVPERGLILLCSEHTTDDIDRFVAAIEAVTAEIWNP